jgi:beta-glucanase (GH16 family)
MYWFYNEHFLGDGVNGDKPFTSARMTTKASWLYGKFEIRARLPKGKHLWPAIWMMPRFSTYGDWPRSGEMDIMEYRGQRPNQLIGTIHFGESKENKVKLSLRERD